MRAYVVLSPLETRHVLRSMFAHERVGPGWARVGYDDAQAAAELMTLAVADTENAVRSGAFEMVEPGSFDAWLARDDVNLDRQRMFGLLCERADGFSDAVRAAMIECR